MTVVIQAGVSPAEVRGLVESARNKNLNAWAEPDGASSYKIVVANAVVDNQGAQETGVREEPNYEVG